MTPDHQQPWHWTGPCLLRGRISTARTISVLGNDRKHKHIFIFFNSLVPGKFEWNFRHVIFKQILVIDGWGISCEIVLIWMSLDFSDDQSTLVQVMAWCPQATSQHLSQCWPRSLLAYGVSRPQWYEMDSAQQGSMQKSIKYFFQLDVVPYRC